MDFSALGSVGGTTKYLFYVPQFTDFLPIISNFSYPTSIPLH